MDTAKFVAAFSRLESLRVRVIVTSRLSLRDTSPPVSWRRCPDGELAKANRLGITEEAFTTS